MTLDKQAVEKLLALNDKQLAMVIKKLTAEAGIDPSLFQMTPGNIQALRTALSMATDEDLARASEQLAKLRKNKEEG
ncbi:MAG: hypothetical protein IIW17_00035 [Clostridia bacterium]|nr:hypothetical protein [Clostridia bacterium]MBQ2255938.1 hypothetical protein [Clostridia bacterium]MBQ5792386.1 hypothetical protein [Clostridia bacterium]